MNVLKTLLLAVILCLVPMIITAQSRANDSAITQRMQRLE